VRGCARPYPPIHPNPNMDYQEKYQPQEESRFFYDGSAMRQPVAGTIARGELHEDPAFHTGKDDAGDFLVTLPLEVSDELLTRGAQRYAIYCSPCHDARGTGRGILYDQGVPTASFFEPRLIEYPDGQIFDVITNGLGFMSGYRYPVPPEDRWAIIAHVRRMQREHAVRIAASGPQAGGAAF